jgi:hypothetical protein
MKTEMSPQFIIKIILSVLKLFHVYTQMEPFNTCSTVLKNVPKNVYDSCNEIQSISLLVYSLQLSEQKFSLKII